MISTEPWVVGSLSTQVPDPDADETREWVEALDHVAAHAGSYRARYLMLRLIQRAHELALNVPLPRATDYVNTIPTSAEPPFPGDEATEREIRRVIRWNAAVMVTRANRPAIGVGGHIATYQSAAALYEVGFNHFFRGKDHPGGGDQVFIQGHAAPGIYARAFLEGRLTTQQLDGFRQELSAAGGGLPSYPHPRLMPEFWEFPTVSMGLGPINAIYQARFNRYLDARGIRDTGQQRVFAFLGDGEMDEPESLGPIGLAAREGLDNLVFVVNCNLQRLDGPVRGNGKIMQELEAVFRGAGWHVIKVVWGREWDPLLAADHDGLLVDAMNTTPDGQFQTYSVEDGRYVREHFFGRDPRLLAIVESLTDDDIARLPRGGHDYRKVYAAFHAATQHRGQPTVILAHTVKGWTLPASMAARMSNHQMKKLTSADLLEFRDRLQLPISDADIRTGMANGLPHYHHPGHGAPMIAYLKERRRALGGYLPQRRLGTTALVLPAEAAYSRLRRGSGTQAVATTMALVRLLKDLLRDKHIGPRIVPIIPDEARTFGMDAIFPTAKIYSPHGQTYESVDRDLLLSYHESASGQILHEGINEAGSMASVTAAGTSYATHGEPMIPFYIFYSMFGFQRTGDAAWAFSDQMGRGFLAGATAGRTTLNGEGLQHQDGHSLLLAASNPACVAYDPAYGFEIAHIVRDGLRRMYGPAAENVWYYLTVHNEPYPQLAEPNDLSVSNLLHGMYRLAEAPDAPSRVRLLASGVAVRWALRATTTRRGMVGRRGGLERPVLDGVATRSAALRAVEPHPPGRGTSPTVRHPPACRSTRTDHRGQRLDACRPRPDRTLGTGPLDILGYRWLRLLGHPVRAAPPLQGRRGIDRGRGADRTRRDGRCEAGRPGRGHPPIPARRARLLPVRHLGRRRHVMDADIVFRAARTITPDGETACTVAVRNGSIVALAPLDVPSGTAREVVLGPDEVLLAGNVDTHVHVNDPGRTEWEGFATATQAAAAGGVTTLVDMPLNSIPPTCDLAALDLKRRTAEGTSHVDVGFWGGAIPRSLGGLRELHEAGVFGFKCFLVDSGVAEFPALNYPELSQAMREISEFDGVLIVHAEDADTIDHSTPPHGRRYRDFLDSRPDDAEVTAIERLIESSRRTGCRVHVLHLSSARALRALAAARADGVRVSVETCPHYLSFAADEIESGATQFKCCPPIRGENNRDALWAGLGSGVIDIVVSDHSPCTIDLKQLEIGDFATAWGGISSLQLGLSAVWTQASARGHSLSDVTRWMSARPAELFGLHGKGHIAVGKAADLCVFAPDETFTVRAAALRHRNPITAYEGRELRGVVRSTWLAGEQIAARSQLLSSSPRGRLLRSSLPATAA